MDSHFALEEKFALKIVMELMMKMKMTKRTTKHFKIVPKEQLFVYRQDFVPKNVPRKKNLKIRQMVISQATFFS